VRPRLHLPILLSPVFLSLSLLTCLPLLTSLSLCSPVSLSSPLSLITIRDYSQDIGRFLEVAESASSIVIRPFDLTFVNLKPSSCSFCFRNPLLQTAAIRQLETDEDGESSHTSSMAKEAGEWIYYNLTTPTFRYQLLRIRTRCESRLTYNFTSCSSLHPPPPLPSQLEIGGDQAREGPQRSKWCRRGRICRRRNVKETIRKKS
jgi:hypothetical protein